MTNKRILVISLGELQQTIYTLPLLSVLKQNDYEVEFLTSEKGFEIVNRNPLINRVHLAPVEQWMSKMPYWGIFDDISECSKKLQKREFDIAIDAQRTFRSFPLVLKCGAKRKLSYSNDSGIVGLVANEFIDKNTEFNGMNIHIVEKNLNFAKYLGLNISDAEFILPDARYSSKLKMDKFITFEEEKPILLLAPDISQGEWSWHPKNWVNFVSNIPEKYNIIIVGSQQDNILANKMKHKNLINLCGKTTFEDLRYVISLADTVISNNIEISSIAWAMNKQKIITIYTNNNPKYTNPYNIGRQKNKYTTLSGDLVCQPCNKNTCTNTSLKCTHYPTVEKVLNSL